MLPNKIYAFLQMCIKNLLDAKLMLDPEESKMSKMVPDPLETYSLVQKTDK